MTTAPTPSADLGRWPSSADGLRAVTLCAVLSVALHGLLLSLRMPETSGVRNWQKSASYERGLQGRVVTLPPPAPRAGPPIAGGRPLKAEPKPQPVDIRRSPPVASREDSQLETLPNELDALGEGDAEPAPLAITPLPHPTYFDDDYVPRPLLTVPPIARAPIIFAPPQGEKFRGRHVGILSLFIDEYGQVQRVELDEGSLPDAFEQAAREAFTVAQFTPGEIGGTAVKSRVRVEVIFDDTPTSER